MLFSRVCQLRFEDCYLGLHLGCVHELSLWEEYISSLFSCRSSQGLNAIAGVYFDLINFDKLTVFVKEGNVILEEGSPAAYKAPKRKSFS